jgi:putative ABC transport system permease protein
MTKTAVRRFMASSKGQTAPGQDQDDTLLMSYTTVMKKIKGTPWLDDIPMSAVSAEAVDPAKEQITDLLRVRHHTLPGGPVLLASVASVSLLIGGVGPSPSEEPQMNSS